MNIDSERMHTSTFIWLYTSATLVYTFKIGGWFLLIPTTDPNLLT